MDDEELLREYVEGHSEPAFAALVERHLPLVFGAAMRVVGEGQAAQDVAQGVFIELARSAGRVRRGQALPGWLYRAAYRRAINAIRGEQRRRRREAEAMKTLSEGGFAGRGEKPAAWEDFAPMLEEAMAKLGRVEQDAVLLRFFQGKSLRETGAALAMSEEAARKRVSRGLEKMRGYFAKRGVTASAGLLAEAISAKAAVPAPAGLAVKITGGVLKAGAGTGGLALTLQKIFFMTTQAKVTTAALVIALLASVPILMQQRAVGHLEAEVSMLVKQNAALREELAGARGAVPEADSGSGNRTGMAVASGAPKAGESAGTPPLDLATLRKLSFSAFKANSYELTDEAISLLGLTPAERQQVQAVLDEVKQSILARNLAVMRALTPEEVTADTDVSNFFKEHTGQKSAYQIPGFSDQEAAAFQQSFLDEVTGVLGADRAKIFVDKAQGGFVQIPGGGGGTEIAFVDGTNAEGNPDTQWMVKYLSPGSNSGGATYWGNGSEAVPERLNGLFQDRTAAASP